VEALCELRERIGTVVDGDHGGKEHRPARRRGPFSRRCAAAWHSQASLGFHGRRSKLRRHSITSSARNIIDDGTVGGGGPGRLAFSAVTVSIRKFPSPGREPERVFTSSQPAIADEILGIERRCLTTSLLRARTRSDRERRPQAGIEVVIAEGLL